MKPQILISGTIVWAHKELEALSDEFDILHLTSPTREAFISSCLPSGPYSSISAIYRHNDTPIGPYNSSLINSLPPSCKFIAQNGAGYDAVDVEACTMRGIRVSNTPGAVDEATATVGIWLLVGAFRQLWKAEIVARAGNFKTGTIVANDPEGKILGIIGMGGIGRALAKRALAFDMKIQYHNRNPVDDELLKDFPPSSITYIPTLSELLKTSDCVSLNLPLNEKTRGSFGKVQFDQMKWGAILINTARGGIIVEEDLLGALESGRLSSAGLDVYPSEPYINPLLLANDKLILLPHMGTETRETQKKMEVLTINNLVVALGGKGGGELGGKKGEMLTGVWEQKGKL